MPKKCAFLIMIICISLINAQENSETSINEKDINNDDKNSKESTKINFLNCDKYCSKFEATCPLIYNEVISLATEYIINNKIIESKTKNFPFEISKAFFYKGIYEYYGIVSDSSSPNLENGLLNFIIASYFGSQEANYRLYILYESDLISHIIYTDKFQSILKNDKLLMLISETDFWKNFEFFYKYPTINKTNEELRHNLQNEIGYNFLYLSILKKYNPAMLVGGTKYSTGVGVEKKCEVATQFIKEVSFQNIAGKINNPDMKGNFVYTRFRLEQYEHIENIYKKENQLTTIESLFQIYNILKDDKDISKKREVISEIGLRYFYGIGTEKDYKKAKEWFEYGTNYQIGQCYAFLGEIYLHGFGLKKEEIDYKKANSLFNQAILNGETAMGYSGLGYMYYYGLGVKKDKREAYNSFLRGIRSSGKESSWEVTSLYFNMISLLIEDDSEDEEDNFETKSIFNDIFVDFDIKEKDEINNNIKIDDNVDKNNYEKNKDKKFNSDSEKNIENNNYISKKENNQKQKNLFDNKVPKDFNLAYKYANYLTLKNRSYGTYILAMMNDYNINSKLFSCEENLNFFRSTSETNEETFNRVQMAHNLYDKKRYKSAFLIILELAYEGHEDSLQNIIALLTKRQIFKNHDYQKYLTYYFIELGLKLEYYDLFFLSMSAQFFYKERKYKKAIDLYKLLINHAGGNDKKFYIAEGFFNLGVMESFGYGLPKNLTKSYKFFEKAESYDASSHYPIKSVKFMNKLLRIFGNNNIYSEDIYLNNKTINETNNNKGRFKIFFGKINILSLAITVFLAFYGWFFFNLKFQDIDIDTNNNA